MVSTPLRVKAIFLEAVELADLAARSAFLDTACAGDTGLRARVERLLSSHDQAAHPTPAASHDDDTTRELPPERLPSVFTVPLGSTVGSVIAGRYRLVDKLGEGGMGEVWRADQSEPVKRQVALKLLHAGMDTRSVNARFEGERQTLALMDHPNIARIYDGGTCGRHRSSSWSW